MAPKAFIPRVVIMRQAVQILGDGAFREVLRSLEGDHKTLSLPFSLLLGS